MNTFLNEVIQQLITEKGIDHLANTTIVVPSRRAMLHVKDCFKDYMVANNLQGPIQLLTSFTGGGDNWYKTSPISIRLTR